MDSGIQSRKINHEERKSNGRKKMKDEIAKIGREKVKVNECEAEGKVKFRS